MKQDCFDKGTLNAFLDGELTADLADKVANHSADCDNCAALLAEAESESAFAFEALNKEFNVSVPTERIAASVYAAINQADSAKQGIWDRLAAFLGFNSGFAFLNPAAGALAVLTLLVGTVGVMWLSRGTGNTGEIAVNQDTVPTNAIPAVADSFTKSSGDVVMPPVLPIVSNPGTSRKNFVEIKNSTDRNDPDQRRKIDIKPRLTPFKDMIGEGDYIKTIATLSQNVNAEKDRILKPSQRIAFEKDVAVVDDAIAKLRKEVRKNPKNDAAWQVLKASYQQKIDLLNSVSEKNELMASLQ